MTHKLLACLIAIVILSGCVINDRRTVPLLHEVPLLEETSRINEVSFQEHTLTVMTLNAAHGRRSSVHQFLVGASRHRRNLDRISEVLERERPGVVALQEADGPSLWSGRFNHVDYLARQAGFQYYVRATHSAVPGLSHGTALLSGMPLQQRLAVTFEPSLAAFPKGFVVATIAWPDHTPMQVDVVSVHLDFFHPRVRNRQIDELIEVIEQRDRPLILMGDFNSVWNGRRKILQKLTSELGLSTFQRESKGLATLPVLGRRLDWIFVSPEFSIQSYETLQDRISDHRAVVARITLRSASGRKTAAR